MFEMQGRVYITMIKLTSVEEKVGRRKASIELLEPFPSSTYESLPLLSSITYGSI